MAEARAEVSIEEAAPAETASLRRLPDAVAAFRSRDFTLFWSGALVSNIGTWMQNVTVPFVIYYRLTHSAPEVFDNRISEASDQYSLAVTYYQLRTGSLPFERSISMRNRSWK